MNGHYVLIIGAYEPTALEHYLAYPYRPLIKTANRTIALPII